MKIWIIFVFYCFTSIGQTTLVKHIDTFVGVDFYENYYYLKQNALFKSSLDNDYQNINYGKPDVVDISNPLQILLLYKLFNKVVVLDNRLNFLTEFDVPIGTSLIANAGKDKIWIYDTVNNNIGLFNFNQQKTEVLSVPIQSSILQLKGNLNQVMAVNEQHELMTYNYVAQKTNTQNIANKKLPISLQNTYTIKNTYLYQAEKKLNKVPFSIKSFEVVNHQLYFFYENGLKVFSVSKK